MLDEDKKSASGCKAYWRNFIDLHETCSEFTTTSTHESEAQLDKMRPEREMRSEIAKSQRDAYGAQHEAVKHRCEIREKQTHESDILKVQALRASLFLQCSIHLSLPFMRWQTNQPLSL